MNLNQGKHAYKPISSSLFDSVSEIFIFASKNFGKILMCLIILDFACGWGITSNIAFGISKAITAGIAEGMAQAAGNVAQSSAQTLWETLKFWN